MRHFKELHIQKCFEKRNPVHIFATKTWSMIKVSADKDADQREIYNKIVLCPICGQKLTDISYINGVVILRVKCRRCKNYINVDIVGTK